MDRTPNQPTRPGLRRALLTLVIVLIAWGVACSAAMATDVHSCARNWNSRPQRRARLFMSYLEWSLRTHVHHKLKVEMEVGVYWGAPVTIYGQSADSPNPTGVRLKARRGDCVLVDVEQSYGAVLVGKHWFFNGVDGSLQPLFDWIGGPPNASFLMRPTGYVPTPMPADTGKLTLF